jgi:hypothetical protein
VHGAAVTQLAHYRRRGPVMSDPNARPPFWQHRYYYLAIKIIVVVCGAYVAARLLAYI